MDNDLIETKGAFWIKHKRALQDGMGIDKFYWEGLNKTESYPKLHSNRFYLIHGGNGTYFGSNMQEYYGVPNKAGFNYY